MDVLDHFVRLHPDIVLYIMEMIPVTFSILCKAYNGKFREIIRKKTIYTLTHHPTKERIASTISDMMHESLNPISFSFLDTSTKTLYVFIVFRKKKFYVLEKYTKTRSEDKQYKRDVLYRSIYMETFYSTVNRYISLFISKYYYDILCDEHLMSKILYNRKKHPLCKYMNVELELYHYYEYYLTTKGFWYPKYLLLGNIIL